jgi:hypothetical protein
VTDLFGNETAPPKRRTTPTPNGYAWTPGSGPDGETCGSCKHSFRGWGAKVFYKCLLTKSMHTHGRATDVLLKSPACKFFERDG